MLGLCYIFIFALQVFWLIRACRGHGKIWPVTVCNLLSVLLSAVLLWYFDTLPGFGVMPGFAYFPEVFASLCAVVAFAVLTLISFLCWLYHRKK